MLKQNKLVCAIAVHVDDLAVIGDEDVIQPLMRQLGSKFKVGSQEPLHHFLSLKIDRDIRGRKVFLSQQHYVEELEECFLGSSHKSVQTPTDSSFKDLHPRKANESESPGPYSSLIGALLWAAQCTRADISFAVNRLSQFLHDPSIHHWQAAIRVLDYLVSTKDLRLCLGGNLTLCGYSDSDWVEDRVDRRSTSGYTYRIGDGAISWKSKKQPTVSLSSTEAEYKALSDSCKEAIWLGNILSELHLQTLEPIPLHVDNEGAEALAHNPEHHTQTKHIDAQYHFVQECVSLGKVKVKHVSTKDMIADMLTKPLSYVLLAQHRKMFGII